MMNKFKGVAFFMIALVSACALHPDESIAEVSLFKKSGVLKSDTKVNVLVDVSEYRAGDSIYSLPLWWGSELSPPKTFIKSLTVQFGDNKSWVRFSAYSDLVNINSVDLNVVDEGFNITIDGGQTATHYKAIIYFDSEGFLLGRKVYSPSFPDEVWEETKYSFIRRQDM
ncbi:MAG: hypothetical protein K1563_21235 [Candidatus Thiodiazotropha sp. (ex. Lucinisca nassula)]|uniref:hypothetical protein n=1 Tax=Candidatus Thiodiazotropha sp. LNASS1 TaxID=3096260 RepID=UPI0028145D30|nr:hypothetical protein [Candidatus Thiodiazotropha sp. (ex. Lucinisca nassula)]